jgi:signal transduction histidine kinase
MKIKTQFRLLTLGIILTPLLVMVVSGVYFSFLRDYYIRSGGFFDNERILRGMARQFFPLVNPAFWLCLPVIAIVIFVMVMSSLIMRSITKSILKLEEAARRLAGGELNLAMDIKGSNEITSFTMSLNRMRNTLKEEERRRYLFIMGVTHDLKTPLALIKANSEALEDGIASSPAEQKHSFDIINNKVDELEGMINSLLDFVRMDTGEWRHKLRMTKLGTFISSYAERTALDAEVLHGSLETDIRLPDDCAVMMDESLVQRALDNIVNNSLRYAKAGCRIRITADVENGAAVLRISDNGPGISAEDLPYVFELFYRGSTSRREQGMGIGLAVVKAIIDSHGWQIEAGPREIGTGACFKIEIPIADNR